MQFLFSVRRLSDTGKILAGTAAFMVSKYKHLMPSLSDGVMVFETETRGKAGQLASKTALFPLAAAVDYFEYPETLSNVLEEAVDKLVADWNRQPVEEKFALEWSEDAHTFKWTDRATMAEAESAVVVSLTTYKFTQAHRRGEEIESGDVQVRSSLSLSLSTRPVLTHTTPYPQLHIKFRSTALHPDDHSAPAAKGYVDGKGRKGDYHGFSVQANRFIDFLREENFLETIVDPSLDFLTKRELSSRGGRLRSSRHPPAGPAAELGYNYRPGAGVNNENADPNVGRDSVEVSEDAGVGVGGVA